MEAGKSKASRRVGCDAHSVGRMKRVSRLGKWVRLPKLGMPLPACSRGGQESHGHLRK